jgi:zinc-binding alcohol dehydrogenase family protein
MKAVGYKKSSPQLTEGSLEDINLPCPEAIGHDLLVEVKAISVNPVDAKIRSIASAETGYKILGWDAVGIVKSAGDKTSLFKAGDRVFYAGDLTRPGSNAEYQLVDERIVALAPRELSDAEAAAMPLTSLTAWELLFDRLAIPLQSAIPINVLVVGAAGGVGSIAVQLLRQLTQVKVIGTASRPETRAWVEKMGAHHVINHQLPFGEQLAAIGVDSVDYVISLTHTDSHFTQLVEILKPQGKLGLIDDPKDIDITLMKKKSLSLHWEFMYTRSMFSTTDMQRQHNILSEVAGLLDNGTLVTTLTSEFGNISANQLIKAHEKVESGTCIGKLVLNGYE